LYFFSLTPNNKVSQIIYLHNFLWLLSYAPWCGHCKKLAPTWDELSTTVGDRFNVAKVDCTEHKELCTSHEVRGYPTILLFKEGSKKGVKFTGQRTIDEFVTFVEGKKAPAAEAEKAAEAPKVDVALDVNADVVVLTDSTFNVARTGVWLVDFYAPWCGHCKKLSPIWDELGAVAKKSGLYKVAKVDVTTEKSLGSEFGIRSLPTIKLFINGKETPYSGDRTVDAFNKFVIAALDGAAAAPAAPVAEEPKVVAEEPKVDAEIAKEDGVQVLTSDNFGSIDGKNYLVKFYAPWCGHCKKLAPIWAELATAHPEYNIAKVDCTVHKEVCQKYEVRGYPTVILLKSDGSQVKYQSARTVESFVDFLTKNY